MTLSITAFDRLNAAPCQHFALTLDVEGAPVIAHVNLAELDAEDREAGIVITQKPGPMSDDRARAIVTLVTTWARYRRRVNRAVVGVNIA